MEMRRIVGLVLAALVLIVFGQAALAADEESHEGKFVRIQNNKLFMKDKDDKEHSHDLDKDIKITVDGKEAKQADLKAGMTIKVTTKDNKKTATKVDARSARTP